jgi:hypothetical protein
MQLMGDKWFGFKIMALAFASAMIGQALDSAEVLPALGRILTGIGILVFFAGLIIHGVSVVKSVQKPNQESGPDQKQ